MRYLRKYIYVDLTTGEITEDIVKLKNKYKEITIIKTKKKTIYVNLSTRLIEITNWYRESKYREQELPFGKP